MSKKQGLVRIRRFPEIQSHHRKTQFWMKSGEGEAESSVSGQTGKTHSGTVLVGTSL